VGIPKTDEMIKAALSQGKSTPKFSWNQRFVHKRRKGTFSSMLASYLNLQNMQYALYVKQFQPNFNPLYLARSPRFQQPKTL
jgi:hypothetical protein